MKVMKIFCAFEGLSVIALFATSMLNRVNPSLCPAIWSDYCAIAWGVVTLLLVLYMLIGYSSISFPFTTFLGMYSNL